MCVREILGTYYNYSVSMMHDIEMSRGGETVYMCERDKEIE